MRSINLKSKDLFLNEESFTKLLAWLDPESERGAGEKYEEIRYKLIKMFVYRGCLDAEQMADETIDRASSKIDILIDNYVGDKRLYFYGIAQNVYREHLRKQSRPILELVKSDFSEDVELKHQCLEHCLQQLPEVDRELILEYYREEKHKKSEHRKQLAHETNSNTLRKKTQRIRDRLKICINKCLSS
jgi:DNA-directed RNA polymerase specialized sigma24 family protein